MPSSNGTSVTHSGRRVVIERAVADMFASGAITATVDVLERRQRAAQRLQPFGVDAVVVCQQYAQHRLRRG